MQAAASVVFDDTEMEDDVAITAIDEDARSLKKRKVTSPPRPPARAHAGPTESSSQAYERSLRVSQAVVFTPTPTSTLPSSKHLYQYVRPPPTSSELLSSMERYDVPSKIYRDPFYSNVSDVPEKPREYAGLVFHLKGNDNITDLEDWKGHDLKPWYVAMPSLPIKWSCFGAITLARVICGFMWFH